MPIQQHTYASLKRHLTITEERCQCIASYGDINVLLDSYQRPAIPRYADNDQTDSTGTHIDSSIAD